MNIFKTKLNKKSGFTLVELLIVVAIIAILIAISIPLVSNALEKARDATDQANERSAKAVAVLQYLGVDDDLAGPGSASGYFYYDAESGKLVSTTATTKPEAYGQCHGGAGDSYNTGATHVGKIIRVEIDGTDGGVKLVWVNPSP